MAQIQDQDMIYIMNRINLLDRIDSANFLTHLYAEDPTESIEDFKFKLSSEIVDRMELILR